MTRAQLGLTLAGIGCAAMAGRHYQSAAVRRPSVQSARKLRPDRDPRNRELPSWVTATVLLATAGSLLYLEHSRPLRPYTQNKVRRDTRNMALALLSAVTIRLTEKPVTDRLAERVQRRRLGLLQNARLPLWLETAAAVLLLDYTLFVWHVLTHKVPLLWRFHRVHHMDLDLDASTALRFHFGEMLLSVPWRAMQVRLFGISRFALSLWQTLTIVAILFHHSDVRLPLPVEKRLARWLMTPRMHGIHHSTRADERDSNWATIFSFPDRLHGSQRFDVPQHRITIGVPDAREEQRMTLGNLVAAPFVPAGRG